MYDRKKVNEKLDRGVSMEKSICHADFQGYIVFFYKLCDFRSREIERLVFEMVNIQNTGFFVKWDYFIF